MYRQQNSVTHRQLLHCSTCATALHSFACAGVGEGGCCNEPNFFNNHTALVQVSGALVGGPDNADNFPDSRPDYQRSEVVSGNCIDTGLRHIVCEHQPVLCGWLFLDSRPDYQPSEVASGNCIDTGIVCEHHPVLCGWLFLDSRPDYQRSEVLSGNCIDTGLRHIVCEHQPVLCGWLFLDSWPDYQRSEVLSGNCIDSAIRGLRCIVCAH
jgi:hypothetical protein